MGPDAARVRRNLLRWFRQADRGFFWRTDLAPGGLTRFQVLLVEFLLWKTSAARSAALIETIVRQHPEPANVIERSIPELEQMLRPLGLFRRRAACLAQTARLLIDQHGGVVPSSLDELQRLPGIGQYAARATACVLEGSRLMPVDANASRIFGRLHAEEGPGVREPSAAWDARLDAYVPRRTPRRFLWATMDLAALVCTPRQPDCPSCPLRSDCESGRA